MTLAKSYSFVRKKVASILGYLGFTLVRTKGVYNQDGLVCRHNHDFMDDPPFRRAYQRGVVASQGYNPEHHWRVHTAIWTAGVALNTEGDFVECGVNAGFMSSAIMQAYEWNSLNRRYFLVDSFSGPPADQFSESEIHSGLLEMVEDATRRGAYVTDMDRVRNNFSEWKKAQVVQGYVPDVLDEIDISRLAFLHLDLNAAIPECAALEYFWPKISNNGVVLLDDYAYVGYEAQKAAIDTLGKAMGFSTLSLPTGQGLIIKGSI